MKNIAKLLLISLLALSLVLAVGCDNGDNTPSDTDAPTDTAANTNTEEDSGTGTDTVTDINSDTDKDTDTEKAPEDTFEFPPIDTDVTDATIYGLWKLPPTAASPNDMDFYQFYENGKLDLIKADENGKIKIKVEGSYSADGEKLTVVLMNLPIYYTYELADDAKTLTLYDHGSVSVCEKYTKELTN